MGGGGFEETGEQGRLTGMRSRCRSSLCSTPSAPAPARWCSQSTLCCSLPPARQPLALSNLPKHVLGCSRHPGALPACPPGSASARSQILGGDGAWGESHAASTGGSANPLVTAPQDYFKKAGKSPCSVTPVSAVTGDTRLHQSPRHWHGFYLEIFVTALAIRAYECN